MQRLTVLLCTLLLIGFAHSVCSSQESPQSNASIAATASSFTYPQSVFVDSPGGQIWVADFDNHRVLRFDVSALTSIAEERPTPLPSRIMLYQNYPNPFNPSTTLSYELSVLSFVDLRVFDILGREVAVLVNEQKMPGDHSVTWNAEGFATGIYLYALRTAERTIVRSMCLLK